MQYKDEIPPKPFRPDFSWQQAQVDLPLVLQAIPEPYRYPAAFMAIAGRRPSEVLAFRTVQCADAARLPLQGNHCQFFLSKHRAAVLAAEELDFLTHYVTKIRPEVIDRARERGWSPSDHLFIRDNGGPISLVRFERVFRDASKQLGLRQTLSPGKVRELRYREAMAALPHLLIQESISYVSAREQLQIIPRQTMSRAEMIPSSSFDEGQTTERFKPLTDNTER